MISGNFYTNSNNNSIGFGGAKMTQPTADFDKIKKDSMGKFYNIVRQSVPEKGKFDDVLITFQNPNTKDEYRLFVVPSELDAKGEARILHIGYKNPDGGMRSSRILKGSKAEILKFLGDESSLKVINRYSKKLKETAED